MNSCIAGKTCDWEHQVLVHTHCSMVSVTIVSLAPYDKEDSSTLNHIQNLNQERPTLKLRYSCIHGNGISLKTNGNNVTMLPLVFKEIPLP